MDGIDPVGTQIKYAKIMDKNHQRRPAVTVVVETNMDVKPTQTDMFWDFEESGVNVSSVIIRQSRHG